MDRCNNQACIKVSARAIGGCLKARAYQIGGEIKARCTPKNIIKSVATLLNQPLVVRCGLVCSPISPYYLRVTPTEVQWITDHTSATFEVRSNVDWIVE